MKKIIAFILCSASSCFGLNMPIPLKPNASSLSQSWRNLSFKSQAIFLTASVISLVSFTAIMCALWPDSERDAYKKAKTKVDHSLQEIIGQIENEKSTPEQIKQIYDKKGNPVTFPFGFF